MNGRTSKKLRRLAKSLNMQKSGYRALKAYYKKSPTDRKISIPVMVGGDQNASKR